MSAADEWIDGLSDGPDDSAALASGDRADRLKKSPSAFRTISEVADDLHIPQHVLRFWETRFPQVRPLKRGGGRRYYRPDDIVLLRRISELLYIQGYTIKGVQRLLREGDGTLRDVPPPDAGGNVVATGRGQSFDETASAEDAFHEAEWAAMEPVPTPPESVEEQAGSEPVFDSVAEENRRLRAMLHAVLEELQVLRQRIPF